MSGELRLDPPRAKRAGGALAQAGAELARLHGGLGAELAAAGHQRPWGHDSLGAAFQHNYDRYAPNLLRAWAELASYVEGLGTDAVQAVHNVLDADEASRRRLTG